MKILQDCNFRAQVLNGYNVYEPVEIMSRMTDQRVGRDMSSKCDSVGLGDEGGLCGG